MKKLSLIILLALSFVPTIIHGQTQTPVSYFGAIPDLKVDGKEFVDPTGKAVTLHGVMDTPNCYFNGGRWGWMNYNTASTNDITACKNYFKKVFEAITKKGGQGSTYCNLFRLHLDPAWLRNPNYTATGFTNINDDAKTATDPNGHTVFDEANICHFSFDKMRTRMADLYVPIIKDALAHGLYIVVRPPGVFPEDVKVGDYYNTYLTTVWDIVSSNSYVKEHSGQIMLELGNEPVRMSGNLADYFQPIVNKIRQNGFNGIILLPGTSYQADYRNYNSKAISDNNYGYAVHNYPGWYGGWDATQSEANFISTFETQVPVSSKPIVITEVDWSPMKQGAGHWNETHTQYTEGNFGTWGTGTTDGAPNVSYKNTQNTSWGLRFRHLVDKYPNISFTLQGTTTYVDMDAYINNGTVKPAFEDAMKAAGYPDARQACSGYCFDWFYDFACGDRVPYGEVVAPEPELPIGSAVGNAALKNGRYEFYTPTWSSFEFDQFKGTDLTKCAELTIELGEATIGYRLDIEILDKDGNSIVSGDYVLGTIENDTRITDVEKAKKQTFDLQSLLEDYVKDGNKIGKIRLNTVVSSDDTSKSGLYYFTLTKMDMNKSEVTARAGTKATSLADVKMYNSETGKEITGTNTRLNADVTNGAEVFGAGLLGNVAANEYADLSAYTKMIIKGTGGSLRVLYNRPATGDCPELNPTLGSGEAVVDLSAHPYFHLNSIKAGWEQTVNVSSITLIDGSGNNVEIADYYITGAGHITDAAQAALDDVYATLIDATGLTNINPWSLSAANPNCLIIYKDDNQVGFTWNETERNLVKNSGGYSAYRTNLYDGYDFRAPFAFNTVGGASYTRNLETKTWGTTVIPFALDVTAAGSPGIYVLDSQDDTKLHFKKVTEGTIPAGSIILYYKAAGGEAILSGKNIAQTVEGFNVQPIAGVNGWYTAQSYTHQVIDDVTKDPVLKDYDVYAVSNNKFVHATKKLTLKPFRALYLHKKNGNVAAKASFELSLDDDSVTGIQQSLNLSEAREAEVYDITGRRISSTQSQSLIQGQRGIYIIRMPNGTVRKVLNK